MGSESLSNVTAVYFGSQVEFGFLLGQKRIAAPRQTAAVWADPTLHLGSLGRWRG